MASGYYKEGITPVNAETDYRTNLWMCYWAGYGGYVPRKCATEMDGAGKRLTGLDIGLILDLIGHLISATSNRDTLSIVLNAAIFSSAKMSWNPVVKFTWVADDSKSTSVREYQVEIGVLGSDIS